MTDTLKARDRKDIEDAIAWALGAGRVPTSAHTTWTTTSRAMATLNEPTTTVGELDRLAARPPKKSPDP